MLFAQGVARPAAPSCQATPHERSLGSDRSPQSQVRPLRHTRLRLVNSERVPHRLRLRGS